jgi:hypothetical protein
VSVDHHRSVSGDEWLALEMPFLQKLLSEDAIEGSTLLDHGETS